MNRFEIPRPRAFARLLLSLACLVCSSAGLRAQSTPESAPPAQGSGQPAPAPIQPASASVQAPPAVSNPAIVAAAEAAVQNRIQRARALTAAHQLEKATSELESVRAASHDTTLRNITSVMLMSIYLEAGNYGRAEALLEENFHDRTEQNGDSVRTYFALAGQAVNGARTHLSRYRSLGINTLDLNLPAEAVTDLDRMRSFLERMIAQAKVVANERKAYDSLSLLEDVLGIRLSLAKDGEDQAKWSIEYVTAREQLAASPTQIASLRGFAALPPGKVKSNKSTSASPYSSRRASDTTEKKPADKSDDAAHPRSSNEPEVSPSVLQAPPKSEAAAVTSVGPSPEQPLSDFGLLNAKASKRVLPRYPPLAKKAGAAGLVRVHVIVDESGKVVGISRSEGPALLKQVAEEAARQWYFEGIAGPGQTVRFTGYIDFNFTL